MNGVHEVISNVHFVYVQKFFFFLQFLWPAGAFCIRYDFMLYSIFEVIAPQIHF